MACSVLGNFVRGMVCVMINFVVNYFCAWSGLKLNLKYGVTTY